MFKFKRGWGKKICAIVSICNNPMLPFDVLLVRNRGYPAFINPLRPEEFLFIEQINQFSWDCFKLFKKSILYFCDSL